MSLINVPTFQHNRRKSGSRPSLRRASGRNLKLEIEYDGTDYCGWQAQNRASCFVPRVSKSIQEVIGKTLQKILQEKIKLIASGRTDAGVHALAQVANFKTQSKISPEKLQRALNGLLPQDISIAKIEEAPLGFHSRFQAKSKVYRYLILNRPYRSALLKGRAYFYPHPLNLKLMRRAAKSLLGRHNFKAFCASGSSVKDTIRTIRNITIRKSAYNLSPITHNLKEYSLIITDIEADGFLYNMVRSIVGTLIEIGRGKLPVSQIQKILRSKNRKLAGPTAPARGLSLIKVKY